VLVKGLQSFDRALPVLGAQEKICRETGNIEELCSCLANQAYIHAEILGRPEAGLPYAEESYMLAARNGLHSKAGEILPLLEYLRRCVNERPRDIHHQIAAKIPASQPKKRPWWKMW
jgi:hypothetical protein